MPSLLAPPAVAPSPAPDYSRPWPLAVAAEHLGVSARTLDRARVANLLRTITLGRRRMVPGDEVRRLAAEGITTR